MRCPRCPTHPDLSCVGETAPRFCQLIDPAHPDYEPAYLETIPLHATAPDGGYPRLAVQAKNLAASLWQWATSGFAMAPETLVAERTAICAACPEWDASQGRCRVCGCVTEIKVQIRTDHCPVDKW